MLTYKETVDLRDDLIASKITLAKAKEIYWKDFENVKRSWQTKDWKDRRKKLLKDKCELCNSHEGLKIQHLSHPRKYAEIERLVTRKYANSSGVAESAINIDDFKMYVTNNYDYNPVPYCPQCNDNRPNKRVKKQPQYRCAVCKHEFDKPKFISFEELVEFFIQDEESIAVRDKCFVSKNSWKNQNSLRQIKYWWKKELAKMINEQAIQKEAFILYLEDNIRYLSFEDAITACTKCATNYDLNKLELCPQCKNRYKGLEYPTCVECLPDDKKKAAYDKIEFAKEMYKAHKDLGID